MASQSIASRKRLLLTALMTQLDSEGSSDEDDNFTETIVLTLKQCEQKRKRHRQQGYVRSIALMFRPDEFVTFFRLSRFSVQQLQENIVQHSSIRCTVERSFGLLKGRFTRLQYINQKSIETIIDTIVTACILHNICILHEDDFADILAEHPVPQVNANAENFDMNVQQMAAIKRLNIARAL